MTAEFSDLSALLTQILSPAMPYLLGMAKQAGDEIGRQAGGTMLARAEAVWARLRAPVEAKEAAREAALDVAADPDRSDARLVLKWQLEKLLDAKPPLAEELHGLLADLGVIERTRVGVIITGEARVSVGGDLVGGDKHVTTPADRDPGASPAV
jgi:hypothetical protein